MTIKDIITMPSNSFFNMEDIRTYANVAMYSMATCILVVSVIQEYLNDRHVFAPIKRFIFVVILLTIMPMVQNFIMERSFEFSDGLMNIITDQEKLEMINDTDAFLEKMQDRQYVANTTDVTEKEEIDGSEFTVTSKKTSFTGVVIDQLKNIPNIAVATLTFGFVQLCISGMQISYLLICLFTGGLFAIPAILSILPTFEGSLEGAFKTFATMFTLPIVVSLLVALLSVKMYEFGEGGMTAGSSIKGVAIVCALCFALAGSSAIAYGLVSTSGISQNLGAIGALGTGFLLNGAMSMGGSLLRNRDSIWSKTKGTAGGLLSSLKFGANAGRNTGGLIVDGAGAIGRNLASKGGIAGSVGNGINGAINTGSKIKSKYEGLKRGTAESLDHHKSHSSPIGRLGGTLSSIGSHPTDFSKNLNNMKMTKESGLKKIKDSGHKVSDPIMRAYHANQAQNAPSSPRWIKKGDLLFNSNSGGRHTIPITGNSLKSNNFSSGRNISSRSLKNSISSGGKFKRSENVKPYKLNNWEKKFMDDVAGKKSLSANERKIKSNIQFVQKHGRKAWENKFVNNIESSSRPSKKQQELYEKIINKRG